jgi:hypothetical protein
MEEEQTTQWPKEKLQKCVLYMYCCWRSNYLETDGVLEKINVKK